MSETRKMYDQFFEGSKYEAKWRGEREPEPKKREARHILVHPDCMAGVEGGPVKCERCGYTRSVSDGLVLYARCSNEG